MSDFDLIRTLAHRVAHDDPTHDVKITQVIYPMFQKTIDVWSPGRVRFSFDIDGKCISIRGGDK